MNGLYSKTHLELEEFVDMKMFDEIQLEILKGIAIAKPDADHGYLLPFAIYDPNELSYHLSFKPLMTAYQEYMKLPDTDPIKITGNEISNQHGYNALSTFIKYSYEAHDLYSHYLFWDYYQGWRDASSNRELTKIAEHFPSLIQWIENLVSDGIFDKIGRAYLIAIDSNGYSFEHRDPPHDPDSPLATFPEFIHVRPNLKRPFYVYDPDTKTKHYIKTRVGWWNDTDVHGGDVTLSPSYAVRIDGVFTDAFRNKIRQ